MDKLDWDTFELYYIAFHEREVTFAEFKEMLEDEIGTDSLLECVAELKSRRKELTTTYYKAKLKPDEL